MIRNPLCRRFALGLWAVGGLMCASTARAQSAADRETARLLMDRGDEQVERGDFDGALKLYLGAHEIMHVPTTGIEVARTYNALGKLVEARDAALAVLRIPASSNEPRPFVIARESATQLATELETLIPVISIDITPSSAAADAQLAFDGEVVPKATLSLPHALNPGAHHVHLTARGFRDFDQDVTLERSDRRALHVVMQPVPVSQLRLSPPKPMMAEPRSASVPHDGPQRSNERATGWHWPMWAGVGIGGAGLVVGSVAGTISLERASAAKKHCEGNLCSPEAKSDRDAALNAARVSNVGFAAGAIGTVVAAGSWWMSTRVLSRPTTKLGLALFASGEAGMLSLYGEAF